MRKFVYPISLAIAFVMSQVPLYLSSINSVYTSYCDTEAWFELQKCLLDPINAIIGATFFFTVSFITIIVIYEFFVFLKKRSERSLDKA